VVHGSVWHRRHGRRGELAGLPVEHPEGDAVAADAGGPRPRRKSSGCRGCPAGRWGCGDGRVDRARDREAGRAAPGRRRGRGGPRGEPIGGRGAGRRSRSGTLPRSGPIWVKTAKHRGGLGVSAERRGKIALPSLFFIMRRRSSRRFSRFRWFSWPCWFPQPRCLPRFPKRSGVRTRA
jgi:hypothetical protein